MSVPLFILQLWQKDNYTFSIEWNDGVIQDFRLCNVQRNCPCARCVSEKSGQRLIDPESISNDLQAISMHTVGRYALHIQFTSGCSIGIYTFDRLRKMR